MDKFKLALILCITFIFSSMAAIEGKGVGVVEYEKRLDPTEEQFALKKAKLDALRRYVSDNFSQAERRQYEQIKGVIEGDLDGYVSVVDILSEITDKSSSTHKKVIRVSIDNTRIEYEISKRTSSSNVASQDKSYMTFVFVARRAAEVVEYDVRRTDVSDIKINEQESVSDVYDANQIGADSQYNKTTITQSGGSNSIKSDRITYDTFSSSGIESTMSRVFSDGGFKVAPAKMMESRSRGLISIQNFNLDYSQGNDLSPTTLDDATRACADLRVKYFATGTLDVGAKKIDPISGLVRVFVNVNAQILDCSDFFPIVVASIGPVQFSGQGPDATVAENNALLYASEEAAKQLVSQLSNKNIY